MKLQIPFFKNKPTIEDKPALVNYKSHVVKPKETKWRLAYEYGLKISELEKINPEIVSGLKIGQQILLPSGKDTVINNFQNELNYYQVKSNENLLVFDSIFFKITTSSKYVVLTPKDL